MRTIIYAILVLAMIGLGVVGFSFWQATQGAPATELESTYLGPNDKMVEVAGATVRVRDEGPKEAPALLLIHGFTHSLETWDGWAEDLKSDFRVIRYDLLGHGLTGPDPQERYAPKERAAFVGEVINALGLENVVIAGNSLGGLAAWRFTAEQGDIVRALILISPGAFPLNGVGDEPAAIPAPMKAYLLAAPEVGVKASAELIYADDSKITEDRLVVMRDMLRREGNGSAMIRSLEEFTLPDPTPDLAKISVPTLIMWGENDILIPMGQAQLIKDAIAGAALITYPGVGHAAQEEAPAQTVADARKFIMQLDELASGN